jgi:glycosyltransferase involved in cell wall biosynthesis
VHTSSKNQAGATKTAIIYFNFLDPRGLEQRIGGVETYLWNLGKLIAERGCAPLLFQAAEVPFERKVGPITVVGVVPTGVLRKRTRRDLFKAATSRVQYGRDLVIFGADHASVHVRSRKCISIQHGVSWDLPGHFLGGGLAGKVLRVPALKKRWTALRAKGYFANCPNRVCVDYNFLNWYRTQVTSEPEGATWIIPNFVHIPATYSPPLPRPWREPVRIIFARRFVEIRGLQLMEAASQCLLARHPHIEITFAGEGPGERRLKERFGDDPRVRVIKYDSEESLRIHSDHDIAVVPSLASEGTSLSLAEAMAAGCAVVASNVGGMTNMVINGYNGRLIDPQTEDLTRALTALITNPEDRRRLGQRASETARTALSLERWKAAWTEVLDTVEQN